MAEAAIMETTQYLTFKLDNKVFALDIIKAREVLDFTTVTKVPRINVFHSLRQLLPGILL